MLEELVGGYEVGQAREELGHVDEVHAGQDVLVETQQAQRRSEQELLVVPAEHVPHPTRQVQRQGLAVQGEDPGRGVGGKQCISDNTNKDRKQAHTHLNICTLQH